MPFFRTASTAPPRTLSPIGGPSTVPAPSHNSRTRSEVRTHVSSGLFWHMTGDTRQSAQRLRPLNVN
jgi:hypothetical protein